jgi:hypothetical protein
MELEQLNGKTINYIEPILDTSDYENTEYCSTLVIHFTDDSEVMVYSNIIDDDTSGIEMSAKLNQEIKLF